MIYGNYSLQRNDNDGNTAANQPPIWGGATVTPAPLPAQTPQSQGGATLAIPQHVHQLQEDLRELGFFMIQVVDGDFGRYTEWAVREFQIYAGMQHVAGLNRNQLTNLTNDPTAGETAPDVTARGQVPNQTPPVSFYVATSERRTNTARYTGPISGVVNQQTRDVIDHWLANNYRCPVVIEAWNIHAGNRSTLFQNGSNIWRYDTLTSTAPRIFYRDFSGHYAYPATRNENDYHVLATNMTYSGYGGPASVVPRHTWPESEMLPDRLIEATSTVAALSLIPNASITSTYRVVRAVAEMECMAAFDSVNAYDDAIASLGPCHWTFGVHPSNGYDDGELPAFLAYFLAQYPDDYRGMFGRFGVYPSDAWVGANAGPLWNAGQRKYAGWVRLHNDSSTPAQAASNLAQLTLLDRAANEASYLKTWHWFFRYVMAGRTNESFRHSMWDMVRIRIRDIREHQIGFTVGTNQFNATIGEVFTSEKATALLLRWHVYRPAHVTGSQVLNAITSAVNANPTLNWGPPISGWTDDHEAALTAAILAAANTVNPQHSDVANWPNYGGRASRGYALNNELGSLRPGRNTLSFNTTGI
ncbi:MAG: hypothetical protein CMN57_06510 [Gammaproteobacteria bacterium]|nr:hypothetical protein [Gammaproteobacteria bacterium]